jgi:hypothetical protein
MVSSESVLIVMDWLGGACTSVSGILRSHQPSRKKSSLVVSESHMPFVLYSIIYGGVIRQGDGPETPPMCFRKYAFFLFSQELSGSCTRQEGSLPPARLQNRT